MRFTPALILAVSALFTMSSSPAVATDDGHQMRRGPSAMVRASGMSEPSFIPPRHSKSAAPLPQTATFAVTYIDFTPQAQTAFQAAVDIASELVTSSVVIRVEANWEDMDGDTLGFAGSNFIHANFPGAPEPQVWYPDALADALRGADNNPGSADILATFASERSDWYFGTDGNTPSNRIDFVTVVLHELMHGLGFTGSAGVENGSGSWGVQGFPMGYDTYVVDGDGTPITDTNEYPNPSMALGDVFVSNDLWWGGPLATTANNGSPPRLYAPNPWEPGSSYSHLNETTYPSGNPNSLMTPRASFGEAAHDPGPISLCIFEEIGWSTPEDCGASASNTYWVATAARASGAGGSQWRTTLGVFNPSSVQGTVDIQYHRNGGSTSSEMLSIPSGTQLNIADVVGFLGAAGSGPIEVASTVPLLVGSRTYNQSDNGTFGQFLDGVPPSEGVDAGGSVWLTLLQENDDFRTNIGFTNTGSSQATVRVTLYDGDGNVVTTFTVTVAAGANKQENQPYENRGGRNDIDAGYASVEVLSGTGLLIYGSVIDNLTGDPTTIPPK